MSYTEAGFVGPTKIAVVVDGKDVMMETHRLHSTLTFAQRSNKVEHSCWHLAPAKRKGGLVRSCGVSLTDRFLFPPALAALHM